MVTRQFFLDEPQTITIFNPGTGVRPKPLFPDLGGSPAKPEIKPLPRVKPVRPGRTATERNGFTGH